MTNSIQTIESGKINSFGSVTFKNKPNEYWMLVQNSQPDTVTISNEDNKEEVTENQEAV